jgi:hypothetical protein
MAIIQFTTGSRALQQTSGYWTSYNDVSEDWSGTVAYHDEL